MLALLSAHFPHRCSGVLSGLPFTQFRRCPAGDILIFMGPPFRRQLVAQPARRSGPLTAVVAPPRSLRGYFQGTSGIHSTSCRCLAVESLPSYLPSVLTVVAPATRPPLGGLTTLRNHVPRLTAGTSTRRAGSFMDVTSGRAPALTTQTTTARGSGRRSTKAGSMESTGVVAPQGATCGGRRCSPRSARTEDQQS
jgi:hypothetical protein